ncbi:hypothetical protein AN189_07460 [Loktanella sp. 3ANDIMAR09]|uniref:hypothetical protein n=1 Tax=Loktanella sp. 3ANDIMAR09 TaxID=1225657 RepID=UPI000701400E|nr:hypothetical protein [Loktanella sp. 3ANDIMAR09]KQI68727.1 hypothetical protein AN189_07460 [Loktanella sp. 3ANDIMAR09]
MIDGNTRAIDAHLAEHDARIGTEEGERCNRQGCDGTMVFEDVEGCSCHINAPCHGHENQQIICDGCGYGPDDEPADDDRGDYLRDKAQDR